MSFEIKGRVALVTGAANGIGLAYVQELLKNGAKGVSIVDIAKNGDKIATTLNKQYGGSVIYILANVTNKEEFSAAFAKTISHFKTLDIVINNAGILNDADWEKEIAINCNAFVEGSLLAIKHMGQSNGGKGGVVANAASILGLQELSGCPVYVGTKHFVVGLTRSFGTEYYWNLTGIKFVTMCPGVTDTSMISEPGRFALQGFPHLGEVLAKELRSLPAQSTTNVAIGMMNIIRQGRNGSVWVSEGEKPVYEVQIPDRLTMRIE